MLEKGTAPTALASGDLDDNSYLDLVVASATSHELTILSQSDSGSFDVASVSSAAASGFSEVVLADVSGDAQPLPEGSSAEGGSSCSSVGGAGVASAWLLTLGMVGFARRRRRAA